MARYRSIVMWLGIFVAAAAAGVYSLPHAGIETDQKPHPDFHRTTKRRWPRQVNDTAARFVDGTGDPNVTNAATIPTREYTLWRQYRAGLTPEISMALKNSLVRELRRYGDEERSRILRFPSTSSGFPHGYSDSAMARRNRTDAARLQLGETNVHRELFLTLFLSHLHSSAAVRRVRYTDQRRRLEKYRRLGSRVPDAARIADEERAQRASIKARFEELLTLLILDYPEETEARLARRTAIDGRYGNFVHELLTDFPEMTEDPSRRTITERVRIYGQLWESLRLEDPARASEESARRREIDYQYYTLLTSVSMAFSVTEENERRELRETAVRQFADFLSALMPEIPVGVEEAR